MGKMGRVGTQSHFATAYGENGDNEGYGGAVAVATAYGGGG